MVPKTSRLPREELRARGYRTMATPFFSLKTKNNLLSVNRIGVVVGKAVDKRATRRNFWKRIAKAELLRLPGGGRDIVMTLSPRVKALTKQDFKSALSKIKL
jgi:ribonuclease P protein component